MGGLVLSLFSGIGLLDMAFEEAGFCVVRGPDLLWGGDVRCFHPPVGAFDGGPPCKKWSPLANVVRAVWGEESVAPDLIPEYERIVQATAPRWFLMENVVRAPVPEIAGYIVHSELINNRWCGGTQNRLRRFCFGSRQGVRLGVETEVFEPYEYRHAITTNSGGRRAVAKLDPNGRVRGKQGSADDARLSYLPLQDLADAQGVSREFVERLRAHGAFTVTAIRAGLGNGVPLPMGRAVAAAVRSAITEGRLAA